MKLVLFQMVSHFQMSLASSKPIRPIRRGFTVAPSDRLRMKVIGVRHDNRE